MQLKEQDIVMGAAAATSQTLPFPVARIVAAASFGALGTAGSTETVLAIVSGAPTGSQVQFTGSANSPSSAVTLGTAAAAGQILKFRVVLPGEIPATL